MVRTLRCGRSNPGSNPGHGMDKIFFSEASDMKIMVLTKHASAGNRTRINCLEGSYADHYTTDASCTKKDEFKRKFYNFIEFLSFPPLDDSGSDR